MAALTQEMINAINSINKEFQNYQIGTLLGQALNGEQPSLSIGTGEIADLAVTEGKLGAGAVTNAKLATDVKVGSLALLTTTEKGSIQGAINELVTSLAAGANHGAGISDVVAKSVKLNGKAYTPVLFMGSDTAATVLGTNAETFDFTGVGDGGTVICNPDGAGNQTATFNFAAGRSVSGASPSLDISAGVDNKFAISVRGDAAEEVTLTLAGLNSGAAIAAHMQTQIRALGGNKAAVTVDYDSTVAGKYAILDSVLGTSSTVVITRAAGNNVTEELKIGTADGGAETAGTGDVANAAAVTAAEVATVVSADMAGITGSDVGGHLQMVSDTTGDGSTLVMGNGTLNAVIGLTNSEEYYGAQSMGLASNMSAATYFVFAQIIGIASAALADIALSITNKAVSGFRIECETTSSVADVDLLVLGVLA